MSFIKEYTKKHRNVCCSKIKRKKKKTVKCKTVRSESIRSKVGVLKKLSEWAYTFRC